MRFWVVQGPAASLRMRVRACVRACGREGGADTLYTGTGYLLTCTEMVGYWTASLTKARTHTLPSFSLSLSLSVPILLSLLSHSLPPSSHCRVVTHCSVSHSLSCPIHHSLLPPHLFIPHLCRQALMGEPWRDMLGRVDECMDMSRPEMLCGQGGWSRMCILQEEEVFRLVSLELTCAMSNAS
jgi:hypothetical protein